MRWTPNGSHRLSSSGFRSTGAYPTNNTVTVALDGSPAEVLWAGLVGPGLYQINIRVPASLSDGDKAVVASIAGVNSQSGALLKVATSAKLATQSAILAWLMGEADPARGHAPRALSSRPHLERLMLVGGLGGRA